MKTQLHTQSELTELYIIRNLIDAALADKPERTYVEAFLCSAKRAMSAAIKAQEATNGN